MAKITQLKKGNENVYPLTHTDGVIDSNGNSVSTVLNTKQLTLVSGSNIKTVNGTSLLGSGDLAVVSVDAGDISVLQSTGTSTTNVMSQAAVTEQVERANNNEISTASQGIDLRLPSGYTQIEWISSNNGATSFNTGLTPNDANWRFVGSWARLSSFPSGSSYSILGNYSSADKQTYMLGYAALGDPSALLVCAYTKGSSRTSCSLVDSNTNVWHTFDLRRGKLILDGVEVILDTTEGTSNTNELSLMSIGVKLKMKAFYAYHNDELVSALIPCINSSNVVGMYDIVRETFYTTTGTAFIAGDFVSSVNKLINVSQFSDAIRNLIKQETGDSTTTTMSQKAVSEELDIAYHKNLTPSYFNGSFTLFKFADFPLLDPRTADGISIVVTKLSHGDSSQHSFFEMLPASITSNDNFYSIFNSWNNYGAGIIKGNYTTVEAAVASNSPHYGAQLVFTVDFKSGQFKIYRNAVLVKTISANAAYSYTDIQTMFANFTRLGIAGRPVTYGDKVSGIAVFGHVLTENEIKEIYGGGCESVIDVTVPAKYKANQLKPIIYDGDFGVYLSGTCNGLRNEDGSYTQTIKSNYDYTTFGFSGITGLINNLIYEWDFQVVSGSAIRPTDDFMLSSAYEDAVVMTDENNNVIGHGDSLVTGHTYHVVCKPNNIKAASLNATSNKLLYKFTSATSDFSFKILPVVKVTERGAALICDTKTYRGTYWEQENGYKIPVGSQLYKTPGALSVYYDTFKESVRTYSSSGIPQFNGQIAVDATNSKIYMGIMSSAGGTWKQVNNS